VTKSLSIFKLFQTGDTDSISRLQIIDNDSRKLIKSASQCIINGEVRDTQYVEQYIPREKSSIHILVKCPAQMQETNFRIEIVSDGIEGVLKNLLLTIKPESYEAINDFIKNTPLPTKN
jgi:hypothetical protein